MTKEYIFEAFKALTSPTEKVEYLHGLAKLNLPYDINYAALIAYWEAQADV